MGYLLDVPLNDKQKSLLTCPFPNPVPPKRYLLKETGNQKASEKRQKSRGGDVFSEEKSKSTSDTESGPDAETLLGRTAVAVT